MTFLPDKDHPLFKDGYDAGMADGHRLMKPLQERIRELEGAWRIEQEARDVFYQKWSKAEAELAALRAGDMAKQAKIDAVMLEHCPEEMTKEQIAEWQRNVAPAPVADGKAQENPTVMRQGGIAVGFIGAHTAYRSLLDEVETLAMPKEKQRVVREWIELAMESNIKEAQAERDSAATAVPADARQEPVACCMKTSQGLLHSFCDDLDGTAADAKFLNQTYVPLYAAPPAQDVELRRDAERYRWLREWWHSPTSDLEGAHSPSELDAAIDAAITGKDTP